MNIMNLVSDEPILVDYFTNEPVEDLRYSDAVVIGSSGNLLRSRLGKKIDQYDAVIRMNCAPIGRFSVDVGSKTTIRVVAHNAIKSELYKLLKDDQILVIWGAPQHYCQIVSKVREIRRRNPKLKIYRLTGKAISLNDAEFEARTGRNRLLSGAWLSTGWFSIFLALNLAESVTVCGFGCSKQSRSGVPYHYWEKKYGSEVKYITQNQKAKKGHRFMTEMDIFCGWCRIYPLSFM